MRSDGSGPGCAALEQRDQITERYQGIVRPIAERLIYGLPFSIELADLIQIGLLRLWEDAEKYDDRRAATFGSYIRTRVRGAMLDAVKGRAYREATHEPLPAVIPIADPSLNVEQRAILREENLGEVRSRIARAKRVRSAIDDRDPKFSPLSRKQKKIIELRFDRGMTQKKAGLAMKITQVAAGELERRTIRILKRKLAA